MPVGREFEAFAVDLFGGLGPIRVKRMFGAAMAFRGDLGFAILSDETIWIKVDEAIEPLFVEKRCPRFTYTTKDGRAMELNYRRLPSEALDDPDDACQWATLGLQAALRRQSKPRRSRAKGRP